MRDIKQDKKILINEMGNIGGVLCSDCAHASGTPIPDMETDRRFNMDGPLSKKKKKDV